MNRIQRIVNFFNQHGWRIASALRLGLSIVACVAGGILFYKWSNSRRPPGSVTPGSVTPGSVTPGSVTPGSVTPGSVTPGPALVVPQGPVVWPGRAAAKIYAILAIKEKVMGDPAMRSESRTLGRQCEALMDELANEIVDPGFIQQLREHAGKDIRATIAVCALDRKQRAAEDRPAAGGSVDSTKRYDAWMDLARRPWAKDDATAYAKWLRALPSPVAPAEAP